MQTNVTSVNKDVKNYKSKIVYSTMSNNGFSVNWKTDWARFRGKTYAQVLKCNIDSNCGSQVQIRSKINVSCSKKKQSKRYNSSRSASIDLPVHAKCKNSSSVEIERIATKSFQCAPAAIGFVCPAANKFASRALDTEVQNNEYDSRVETHRNLNTKQSKSSKHFVKVGKKPQNVKTAIQYLLVIMNF